MTSVLRLFDRHFNSRISFQTITQAVTTTCSQKLEPPQPIRPISHLHSSWPTSDSARFSAFLSRPQSGPSAPHLYVPSAWATTLTQICLIQRRTPLQHPTPRSALTRKTPISSPRLQMRSTRPATTIPQSSRITRPSRQGLQGSVAEKRCKAGRKGFMRGATSNEQSFEKKKEVTW